ncbi:MULTISPECIES: hypothetical protein [unclassified Microcoleus]|uniref:hypothetical protein n=1 Tax=unclassified Microcoleus TaxID=2642155 RepID=UPI002FD43792
MQRLNAICGLIENLVSFNSKYFDINEFSYGDILLHQLSTVWCRSMSRKTLEDRVGILINAIKKSALTDPLKTQVLMKIDTICQYAWVKTDPPGAPRIKGGTRTSSKSTPTPLDSGDARGISGPEKPLTELYCTICYKGCSVIRINIPSQKEVSFVGEKAFIRENTSTVEAKGPKLLAVSQRFQK